MPRARDLGIIIGTGATGVNNAITDVAGVRVGYSTIINGDDVRTGVTVVLPFEGSGGVFAGVHRLNGNGEMTGWHYLREMGILTSPIAITNTHSVGAVHEAIIKHAIQHGTMAGGFVPWALPVVAETWDGQLNDINGFHVRAEHVADAIAAARSGPIAEGNVGGGTGMISHGFKGGTGTASRHLPEQVGGYTVGVLVQANHGSRRRLRIDGVPVGQAIGPEVVPMPGKRSSEGEGSIIVIVATDAPLLPHQCERLARRAGIGIGRVGGLGEDSSGDLALAFATGNRIVPWEPSDDVGLVHVDMLQNTLIDPLFEAVSDATEEAIVNALLAADMMTGYEGRVAYALPHDRLLEVMRAYGRL